VDPASGPSCPCLCLGDSRLQSAQGHGEHKQDVERGAQHAVVGRAEQAAHRRTLKTKLERFTPRSGDKEGNAAGNTWAGAD
jgi:hypothetical protein